jgi:hypothetical protein
MCPGQRLQYQQEMNVVNEDLNPSHQSLVNFSSAASISCNFLGRNCSDEAVVTMTKAKLL